jgi:DNA-binding transcriptional LysR family regulator
MEWHDRIGRRLRLRDLHTLVTVARRGSMAKAAAELAITQPAVSRVIADMEHTLGVPLLDRKPQGVEPALFGHALIKWGDGVFEDLRHAIRDIQFLADPTSGEVRIGTNGPMAEGLLPAVIDRVSRQYPNIYFQVALALDTAYQYGELRGRKFDLILGRIPQPFAHEDLNAEVLFDDRIYVVAGAQNQWARKRKVKLADLIDEPWVLPRPEAAAGAFVQEAFRANGMELPRHGVSCGSLQFTYMLMATGRYLGLFPASLLHFSGNRFALKVLPVKLTMTPPPVGIVTVKNRTILPAAKLFIDCLRTVASPLAGDSHFKPPFSPDDTLSNA